jgi:hypothetical protein
MKKATLAAAMLIAAQSSYGADWQYDYRRCAVGHGDFSEDRPS